MLMEDIEVKVYRSIVKLPVIFFVPATFVLTVYVVLYLAVNSQAVLQETLQRIDDAIPGTIAIDELVVEPTFTNVHLWGVTLDGRDGTRVVTANEVHAGINPLPLLVKRIQVDHAEVRDGAFEMRVEGEDNRMNLLDALGLEDRPDTPDDAEPAISGVSLNNLKCLGCRYSLWIDILEFEVPEVDIMHGDVDIADGVLLMQVPEVKIPRGDFELRHWLYYFPEEKGNWQFTVEDVHIVDWAWAGEGFTVESVRARLDGLEVIATGMMSFPTTEEHEEAKMTYRARGTVANAPWSTAGQYFVEDLFHLDARWVEIAVEGDLQEIGAQAQFEVGVLDAYGLQLTDLAGTAVLNDEIVVIDDATGTIHGGDAVVKDAYFDLYTGRFGGDIRFSGVDPAGIVRDFGFDYPWLQGRAAGELSVLGRIPFDDQYGPDTSPYAMLNQFLRPTVEVTLPSDLTLVRTGAMDTLPGQRFRIAAGSYIWATEDRVGIDDATIIADNATMQIDDFVFDWERYELLRDQYGEIAKIRLESSQFEDLLGDYGGSGIDGRLSADLTAVGRVNYPDVDFDLDITNPALEASGVAVAGESLAAAGRIRGKRLFVDKFDVASNSGAATAQGWIDVLRDPRDLRDEDGEIVTDFLSPRSHPAEFSVEVSDLDVAAATALSGTDLDVGGRASGSLELTGTLENPDAAFSARVDEANLFGQSLRRVEFAGEIADRSWQLQRAIIDAGPAGQISGWANVGFDESLAFEARGTTIDLTRIEPLRSSGINLGGGADFYFHGEGTLDTPKVGGDARITDFTVADRQLGDLALVANTIGDTTHLVGALLPWVTVELEVPLDGESSYYARFGIDHLDVVDAVPELRNIRIIDEAEATGTVEVFVEPGFKRYQVLANLSEVRVEALNKTFRNEGALIAGLNNGELFQIQQATIGTRDRLVSIQGGIFLDQALIDLQLSGDLDLSLLTGFRLSFPEFFPESFLESRGVLAIDAAVKGTPGLIVADGYIDFGPSEVLLRDVSDPLVILSGRLEFDRESIIVPRETPVRGRILGGVFSATGSLGLDGMSARNLEANVWTRNMGYRIPEVANLTFDTELRLEAPDLERPDTWQLTGDIDILDGLYYQNISIFQEQLTNRLIGAFSRRTEQYEASLLDQLPVLEEMSFDIDVRARDGFRIQNEIDRFALDLELRLGVRLQNTLADPRLTGDIDVIDGGVTFQGETFDVRNGNISFLGNPDNPQIDIIADADIFNTCRDTDVTAEVSQTMSLSGVVDTGERKSYHITLNVRGRLDNLDIQFESNPYADQRDILSLLLTGCTVDQLTASSASSPTLEVALGPVLGWIEGQVQDVVEVEEFTITPSVDRLKATVGDSISRRLSWRLQLDTGLTEVATGQRLQLEYKLSDRWSAQASESSTESSQFDSFLVDFKLRYRLFLD